MKKVLFVVFIVVVISSCKKAVEAFGGFDATLSEVDFVAPAITNPLPFPTPEVKIGDTIHQHFDVDSLIKANTGGTFSYADIVSIKLKTILIQATDATPATNLSNFQSARLTLFTDAVATPIEVVSINPFPTTYTDSLNVPSSGAELKSYLAGKQLNYLVYGSLRRSTITPLHLKVKTVVTVK